MAQSPPLLHAHQTRHQPPATMVKSSLLRPMTKQSPPRHHHLPWHHLLPPVHGTSLFLWRLSQGRQGWSFRCRLYRRPPRHPLAHLLHLHVFGRDAQLQGLAGCQILSASQKCFSSSTIICHGIGINRSSGSLKT